MTHRFLFLQMLVLLLFYLISRRTYYLIMNYMHYNFIGMTSKFPTIAIFMFVKLQIISYYII